MLQRFIPRVFSLSFFFRKRIAGYSAYRLFHIRNHQLWGFEKVE